MVWNKIIIAIAHFLLDKCVAREKIKYAATFRHIVSNIKLIE